MALGTVGTSSSSKGDFWINSWEAGNIPWHVSNVDPLLQKYYSFLTGDGTRMDVDVFVPLCGKTLDMIWLAEQGASVVGCELSDLAVQQFFTENSLQFSKASTEKFTIYKATDKRITFLVGDMYDITSHDTGTFDVVWDCSSFGAINPEDRSKYYTVTKSLLRPSSRILMSCYDFDVSLHRSPPPPYPIVLDTVESYYGKDYSIAVLEKANVPGFPMLRCIYSMQEK